MFLISSSRFRREIKGRLFFWRRPDRVFPFQQSTRGKATLENKTPN
jgi:hypothetical protein